MNREPSVEITSGPFASKGRAVPACSEALLAHRSDHFSQADNLQSAVTPNSEGGKPQEDQAGSVLSIDLRRPIALDTSRVLKFPPNSQPSSTTTAPPTAKVERKVGLFVALVASIGFAGGLFYVFNQDRPRLQHFIDELYAAVSPANERTASSVSESSENTPYSAEVTQASEPEIDLSQEVQERVAQPEEEAFENSTLPSFDLVRVEPDGAAVIAGRAAPYAELILLHNGEPIGRVIADWAGEWVFVSDKPLETDRHQLTLLINKPDASITIPAADNLNSSVENNELENLGSRRGDAPLSPHP